MSGGSIAAVGLENVTLLLRHHLLYSASSNQLDVA